MIEWKQRVPAFKAWDKKTEKTYPVAKINYDWECAPFLFEVVLLEFQHGYLINSFKRSGEDVVLLEDTGLKDKNGKEIYEGDIARDISGKVAVIVYSPPSFFAQFKGELWDINTKGSPVEMVECIEVIGNIFENPELLEDKP